MKTKGESKGGKDFHLTLDSYLIFVRPAVALICISFAMCLFLYILAQAHSISKDFGERQETKQCRPYSESFLFHS